MALHDNLVFTEPFYLSALHDILLFTEPLYRLALHDNLVSTEPHYLSELHDSLFFAEPLYRWRFTIFYSLPSRFIDGKYFFIPVAVLVIFSNCFRVIGVPNVRTRIPKSLSLTLFSYTAVEFTM